MDYSRKLDRKSRFTIRDHYRFWLVRLQYEGFLLERHVLEVAEYNAILASLMEDR